MRRSSSSVDPLTGNNEYDLVRILVLNKIKIKNPEKWDQAQLDDYISNEHFEAQK